MQIVPDTNQYTVVAGSDIKFSWLVENATQVILFEEGQSRGGQPFDSNTTVSRVINGKTYELRATNSENKSTSAFIQIQVEPYRPDPPTSLSGKLDTATLSFTLNWFYSPENESDIKGFKIYRVPGGSDVYMAIVDENTLSPTAREWSENPTDSASCYKYYVVAVYTDIISGESQETNSSNGWNNPSCP